MTLAEKLGKCLRQMRGEIPQVIFAKRLGVSKSSFNRIELGEQNVSLKMLEVMCNKLKCDVTELLK